MKAVSFTAHTAGCIFGVSETVEAVEGVELLLIMIIIAVIVFIAWGMGNGK